MTFDYQVHLLDNMGKVNEMVTENEDCSYSIFINGHLCETKRLKAFQHAMSHITEGDFSKNDIQKIEYDAHRC